MTVKEHLFFHAVTKMSNHFTKEQMAARIEAVRAPSLPPLPYSIPFSLPPSPFAPSHRVFYAFVLSR
jgi:hypothetical protein